MWKYTIPDQVDYPSVDIRVFENGAQMSLTGALETHVAALRDECGIREGRGITFDPVLLSRSFPEARVIFGEDWVSLPEWISAIRPGQPESAGRAGVSRYQPRFRLARLHLPFTKQPSSSPIREASFQVLREPRNESPLRLRNPPGGGGYSSDSRIDDDAREEKEVSMTVSRFGQPWYRQEHQLTVVAGAAAGPKVIPIIQRPRCVIHSAIGGPLFLIEQVDEEGLNPER
ncbi:hypothetical protein KM043_013827 [Ampulex compressa]|nr:hypothetical protein KM043_013827 [Ampulex compressa]